MNNLKRFSFIVNVGSIIVSFVALLFLIAPFSKMFALASSSNTAPTLTMFEALSKLNQDPIKNYPGLNSGLGVFIEILFIISLVLLAAGLVFSIAFFCVNLYLKRFESLDSKKDFKVIYGCALGVIISFVGVLLLIFSLIMMESIVYDAYRTEIHDSITSLVKFKANVFNTGSGTMVKAILPLSIYLAFLIAYIVVILIEKKKVDTTLK